MKVVILEEHGIDFAFAGLGLSFSVTSSTIHEGPSSLPTTLFSTG